MQYPRLGRTKNGPRFRGGEVSLHPQSLTWQEPAMYTIIFVMHALVIHKICITVLRKPYRQCVFHLDNDSLRQLQFWFVNLHNKNTIWTLSVGSVRCLVSTEFSVFCASHFRTYSHKKHRTCVISRRLSFEEPSEGPISQPDPAPISA